MMDVACVHVRSAAVTDTGWWPFLQRHLDERGWTATDLAVKARINASTVSRWKSGAEVTVANARTIAEVLGAPPLAVFIAAGIITEQEAQLRETEPDARRLTNAALLAELKRRIESADVVHVPSAEEIAGDPSRFSSGGSARRRSRGTDKDA